MWGEKVESAPSRKIEWGRERIQWTPVIHSLAIIFRKGVRVGSFERRSGPGVRLFVTISGTYQFHHKFCKFIKIIGVVDFDSLELTEREWGEREIRDPPCEAVR